MNLGNNQLDEFDEGAEQPPIQIELDRVSLNTTCDTICGSCILGCGVSPSDIAEDLKNPAIMTLVVDRLGEEKANIMFDKVLAGDKMAILGARFLLNELKRPSN